MNFKLKSLAVVATLLLSHVAAAESAQDWGYWNTQNKLPPQITTPPSAPNINLNVQQVQSVLGPVLQVIPQPKVQIVVVPQQQGPD